MADQAWDSPRYTCTKVNEDPEIQAMLALTLTGGIGPRLTQRCLTRFGSAADAIKASAKELATVQGIGPRGAQRIRKSLDQVLHGPPLEREIALVEEFGVELIPIHSDRYPSLLRHIPDPPPLLYVRGDLEQRDALALAVVGSRKCTFYGREQADRLCSMIAQSGITIVSGGARGIDAAAHHAALRVQGRTIAVLGSGIARPYPSDNREMFDRIAGPPGGAPCGAVISEFPMQAPPVADNFPRRNRIVSGLSLGVLVVEAAARSGALITARLAAEEHNREVMAVPGRIDSPASSGCHKMIREGWASLVTSGQDILESLGETGRALQDAITEEQLASESAAHVEAVPRQEHLLESTLTEQQQLIYAELEEPRLLDELVALTELPASTLQSELTMLQVRGMVVKRGAQFSRKKAR